MSRHSLKLVLVGISLGSLTLALPTRAPWRDDATLAPTHINSELLQGLMSIQDSTEPDPTLARPDDSKAVARARHWLKNWSLERRQGILQTPPEDLPALLVRRNPYQLSGCLFVGGATGAALLPGPSHCLPPATLPQARAAQWSVLVPGATDLGTALAAYRLPSGLPADASQSQPAQAPGKLARWHVSHDRPDLVTTLVKGRDAMLTLLPEQQQAAQHLLERMTARRPEPLPALQQRNAVFMEQARARMLGLLVVDIATGQIEVAASSTSPCYAQWHASNDKHALPADCAGLPPQQRPNPLNLRNAALYFDGMPGSPATKLLEGLTLLSQGTAPETLRPLLLGSKTVDVIDLMFCADRGFDLGCANRHLSGMADWVGRLAPAQVDLLGPLHDRAHPVHGSRLLAVTRKGHAPVAPESWPELTGRDALVNCHQRGAKLRWRGCHGAHLVDTVAELMGQGNARVTPVGVASQ